MQNNIPSIEVKATREFQRDLRELSKKYRHIRSDVQAIIEQLQAGELIGDQITGTGYQVFKVRVKNSDLKKGKRAGYRLIYYLKKPTSIILITIYSKSEQSDISSDKIQEIVLNFNEGLVNNGKTNTEEHSTLSDE